MDWVRGEKLGHGSFGTVNLALSRSKSSATISNTSAPQVMAVKSCGASNSASLVNEKNILDKFRDCAEIIQCFGDCYSYDYGDKLYNVFLEYASQGSLSDKLKNSAHRSFPESQVRGYAKGILRGLNRIHGSGYVHCDIKLQNILLTREGAVKIADFGLAKKIGEGNCGWELRGTPLYMSPEMVVRGNQGTQSDVWALGCLVAEMASGAPVWRYSDMAALLMKIGIGEELPEIPSKFSEEGKDFLGKCFIKDPSKRWTAEMLLDHPFVASSCQDDHITVPLKDTQKSPSTSPRSAFDFPDWTSQQSSLTFSFTSSSSPAQSNSWFSGESQSKSAAKRLQLLVNDQKKPDWSVSDDWVTIR